MTIKSYRELRTLNTFEDRFDYLKLQGVVGEATFGFERYLNQMLYRSREWKYIRKDIILRDASCDLGIRDREIYTGLVIHHINPITMEDVECMHDCIFDPDNLITASLVTHNAIHYGDGSSLVELPIDRKPNDTRLW